MASDQSSFRHGFAIGDRVQVMGDEKKVKQLQVDHGGWVDAMGGTIGQKGKIARLYQDGDVRVEVSGSSWTYNPNCLRIIERMTQAPPSKSPVVVPPPVPSFSQRHSKSSFSAPKPPPPSKSTTSSVPTATPSTQPVEKPNCIVCFEEYDDEQHKVIAFLPCGHTVCMRCSAKMTQCHVCRKAIASKIPIYM
eukprot:TRINITY_DN6926_c0_g5_i1.p1 TRINITY_DN6926_c0_g5~~TRINITY_DN6926_c0_g5_i1.p1  ORF type:complete len:208 (-),score=32.80 TRINITY_DN6926_c0_g5_i1:95-670(-)